MKSLRIVNFAEIADRKWTFLQSRIRTPNTIWHFYSSVPQSWLERLVRRPNIARLRGAATAGFAARHSDVLVSHLPLATLWLALCAKVFGINARHLAFSFNFTDLPSGFRKILMRFAFQFVDRFVVYSEAEKRLYAQFFGLDEKRFDVLRWCMDVPKVGEPPLGLPDKYVCAVGGEGRDYTTLLEAARKLPDIPVVIVARPTSLRGMAVPANVVSFVNLPAQGFWSVVQHASFVSLPLRTPTTNCGHISIVGSHLLGKPVVATYSAGTKEYLDPGVNALLSAAGDVDGLAANIREMWINDALRENFTKQLLSDNERYSLDIWSRYVDKYIQTI